MSIGVQDRGRTGDFQGTSVKLGGHFRRANLARNSMNDRIRWLGNRELKRALPVSFAFKKRRAFRYSPEQVTNLERLGFSFLPSQIDSAPTVPVMHGDTD